MLRCLGESGFSGDNGSTDSGLKYVAIAETGWTRAELCRAHTTLELHDWIRPQRTSTVVGQGPQSSKFLYVPSKLS